LSKGVVFTFSIFVMFTILVLLSWTLYLVTDESSNEVNLLLGADAIYYPSENIRENIVELLLVDFTVIGDDNMIVQNVTLSENGTTCGATEDLEFYANFTHSVFDQEIYPHVEINVTKIIEDSERRICSYEIDPLNISYEWNFEIYYVNLTGAIDCIMGMQVIMVVPNATVQTMTGSGKDVDDGDFYYYFAMNDKDSNSTYDRVKSYTIQVQLKEAGPPPNPDAGKVTSIFDFWDADLRIEFEDIKWDVITGINTTIMTEVDPACLDGKEIKVLYANTYLNVSNDFGAERTGELSSEGVW
jgi:hypothetical protein